MTHIKIIINCQLSFFLYLCKKSNFELTIYLTIYIMNYTEKIKESAAFIQSKIPKTPDTAIVLGSGLGNLAEHIQNPIVMPYSSIPNFM